MEPQQIKSLIEEGMTGAKVDVTGDGSHFEAVVVADSFAGLNTVKRHKAIYSIVNAHIRDNSIHALSIKAYTPEEWDSAKKLRVSSL